MNRYRRWLIYFPFTLCLGFLFFWGIIYAGVPPKRVATWTFVIVWFLHLAIGAGAGYAAWRLWPAKENKFARFTMIHLHAVIIDALGAIVLIFLARNVRFTWTFSLALFSLAFLRDVVRMPLIFYIIRGPTATEGVKLEPQSGDMPPDFWRKEFRDAIKDVIKPEYLKEGG